MCACAVGDSRLRIAYAPSDIESLLTSTTLSDPQLMKPLFGLVHPPHVLRAADHQQPCEDLLYNARICGNVSRSPARGRMRSV